MFLHSVGFSKIAANVRPLTDRRGNRREISLPNADEVMENIVHFAVNQRWRLAAVTCQSFRQA